MSANFLLNYTVIFLGFESVIIFCAYKWGWHRGAAHAYGDIVARMKAGRLPSYSIAPGNRSITCHVCGLTSYLPKDVENKFCGKCHVFHDERWLATQ